MDVIINADCDTLPEQSKALPTQGTAALNLLAALGYDTSNPPLADLLRSSNALDGNWTVATPIHWTATHNDAMIVANGNALPLDEAQFKQLYQQYANFLLEQNDILYYYDAGTWLLEVHNKPSLTAKPVQQLLDQSLMPELARLDSSMYWQKFFTESQMFFASHTHQTIINGVWLWGSSVLDEKKSITIYADELLLPLANTCTTQAILYHPDLSLKKCSIVLLTHSTALSESHLAQLKKTSANWYWNNRAYAATTNWFTKIWRAFTYAH